MLEPVGRSGTITEAIARQLIQLIMNGRYKPGDRLPSEFELANEFRAGRGAVREALKALSVVGLVRVVRGKGTFVGEPESFLTRPLSLGFKLDTQLRRLIEARKLVEVELAGLAAERASEEQVQAIQACNDHMRHATKQGDLKRFLDLDMEFHFRIARAADNLILSQFLTLIRHLMQKWMSESTSVPQIAADGVEQHQQICATLRNRQPRAARAAMEYHLTISAQRFLAAEEIRVQAQESSSR